MATAITPKIIPGGTFLLADATPEDIFTPEDFSEEQQQIARTTAEFAEKSILPRIAEIEAKNFAATRALLLEAGSLGLMAVDIPEAYGGLALDKVTAALISDRIAVSASFSVSFSAHTGIGTLPVVWYGTPAQKEKYLPKLASGEWIAAYALSESSSGSDAMNIRAQARLSPDRSQYILNGEKMWISNAGFADLFIVFAKIVADSGQPDQFSAFLIERGTPGLTIGAEEHKLGIRGSSTCPLVLSDCAIPAGNLLGEAGKGHHIAFNILNVGRYKLGAATVGGARHSLREAIRYAKQRIAFGKPIASFGLVQEKLAETAAGIFAGEALVYRVVGAIDAALSTLGPDAPSGEVQKRIEDYAVECSIVKVWCSEMLERAVDNCLQIHGGYGYVEEYPAERSWRDARINRIFEGTNEINRLIITGFTMKRAMQGRLALLPAIRKVMDEVMAGPSAREEATGPLAQEKALLASAKKLGLFCSGAASQKYPTNLLDQQEIMGALADILIEILVMESAILRAEKFAGRSATAIRLAQLAAARSFCVIRNSAERILGAVAEGDMLRTQMAIFRRLAKHDPINTIAIGRAIAEEMITAERYTL
ncbi:MAG TPA: acyl-CoA dehydrogenase family protein [Acidobacteriaceae bacterium]|jgi:butyryl-CoA dehydrogenase|nr:acyl-CoA dehydrogenase family protein [Acidobacteriaceae bacterium]